MFPLNNSHLIFQVVKISSLLASTLEQEFFLAFLKLYLVFSLKKKVPRGAMACRSEGDSSCPVTQAGGLAGLTV